MAWSILKVTDGTTSINLLSGPAFYLGEWKPVIAEAKGGGVWRDSPLGEGRRLAFRRFNNAIETFILDVSDTDQEAVIHATQDLRRLLEAAIDYWTGAVDTPVWIEARAECETESRYALIYDYRTPQDGDPYGSEFAPQSGRPHFHEWQLLIERGHWMDQPPGASNCVQLSSIQPGYLYGADLILNGGFETLGGGGADVFADWTESAAGVSAGPAIIGARCARLQGALHSAYVQQNCAVAPGKTYLLTFYCKPEVLTGGVYSVLDITHAVPIIDQAAALSSPPTATSYARQIRVTFTVPAGCNTVGILLASDAGAGFHVDYDNVTLMEVTAYDFGRAASCDEVHYISNRFQPAQLTHVFYYDNSLATFSANLMLSAPPFDLFPNPIEALDTLYIGVADGSYYPGPFDAVVFNLDNNFVLANVGEGPTDMFTFVQYYAADGTWDTLNLLGGTDHGPDQTVSNGSPGGTTGKSLEDEGVNIMAFFPPSEDVYTAATKWVRTTINGVYGWWVRIVANTVQGAPRLQQVTDKLYTPTIPRLSVAEDQLAGDISALLSSWSKMAAPSPFGAGVAITYSGWAMTVSLREQSRGASFNPYINITYDVQIPGISMADLNAVRIERCDFPGRTLLQFTVPPGGVGASYYFRATLDSTLVNSYRGEYRAFLRVGYDSSAALLPEARMSVEASGLSVGDWIVAADDDTGDWQLTAYDFGRVSIPVGNTPDKPINEICFHVEFQNTSAAAQVCQVYDLVLIPIDECLVSVINPNINQTYPQLGGKYRSAVIDSFYFRDPLRSFTYHEPGTFNTTPEYLVQTLDSIGTSGLNAKPGEDYFVFFMTPKIKEGLAPILPIAYRPRLYAVSRYLSMRGAR